MPKQRWLKSNRKDLPDVYYLPKEMALWGKYRASKAYFHDQCTCLPNCSTREHNITRAWPALWNKEIMGSYQFNTMGESRFLVLVL